MKSVIGIATVVVFLTAMWPVHGGETTVLEKETKTRIGIYDSRAVAVAYAGSALHSKAMSAMMAEHKKAKESGEQKRVGELEAKGSEQQKLFHKQGFSTAPVTNILEQISDQLPAIRAKAGVSALVSKWDADTLARYPSVERVDVTMALVDAFNPGERQRKNAVEIQKREPIPLEQAENFKE